MVPTLGPVSLWCVSLFDGERWWNKGTRWHHGDVTVTGYEGVCLTTLSFSYKSIGLIPTWLFPILIKWHHLSFKSQQWQSCIKQQSSAYRLQEGLWMMLLVVYCPQVWAWGTVRNNWRSKAARAFSNTTPQCFHSKVRPPHVHLCVSPPPWLWAFSAHQRVLEDLLCARGGDIQ